MLNLRCLLAKNEITLKYLRKLIIFFNYFNKKFKLVINNIPIRPVFDT